MLFRSNWDMSSIPRVAITDSMSEKEKAHFERYNEECEATELLWIGLEIERLEAMEKEPRKTRSDAGKRRKPRAWFGADVMDEIHNPSPDTLFDNQGATEAIRFDDDFDYDDSHR